MWESQGAKGLKLVCEWRPPHVVLERCVGKGGRAVEHMGRQKHELSAGHTCSALHAQSGR